MRVCTFTADVPKDGTVRCECKDFRYLDVSLVPLEDENAVVVEHSHTFVDAPIDELAPVLRQSTVLLLHPRCVADALQVWRVEDYELERFVGERHVGAVLHAVRMHRQLPSVAQLMFLVADVGEHGERVLFVEPEHPASAAAVENGFVCIHIVIVNVCDQRESNPRPTD